jgi:glycosyltransferase involved in cell wall biosynthesis
MTPSRALVHVLADCDAPTLDCVARLGERALQWGWQQRVVCLEPTLVDRVRSRLGCLVCVAARRFGWTGLGAVSLRRCVAGLDVRLMVAWGAGAAATCRAGRPDVALVVVLHDLAPAGRLSRWVRSVADERVALVAPSQLLRRRLIEAGANPRRCRLIRPPVDSERLRSVDAERVAAELALPGGSPVLLMPGPPSRTGGHRYGVWAAALLQQRWADVRIIVPGSSPEQRRLRRFAEGIELGGMTVFTGDRYGWPELLAVADVLLVPATGDVDTTPLAWAMAAGVPIVGTATPAVEELIAAGRTGLLAEPRVLPSLTSMVMRVMDEQAVRRRIVEQARGVAFELFHGAGFDAGYHSLFDELVPQRSPLGRVQRLAASGQAVG